MATENLEIIIGANTQDLQTGLNQASQSVTNFGNAVRTNLKPTADATNALSNLSRVAQDAPYGFMGIANNLNPLLESFQRLSKESGGAGSALKALVGGLTGPAGIGLALGAVSSAVIAFGGDIADWIANTGELEKANKQLRASFIDTLKTTEATIANDQALLSVINDVTQSTEAREAALSKLKAEYKGNVDLQKTDINDGKQLEIILNKISDALIRKAQIEATSKIIGEKYAELIRLQTAGLEEQISDLSAWSKGWDFVTGSIKGAFNGMGGLNSVVTLSNDALENNAQKATKTQKAIDSLKNSLSDLYKESYKQGDYSTLSTTAPKAMGGTSAANKGEYDLQSTINLLKAEQKAYKDDIALYSDYTSKILFKEEELAKAKAKERNASMLELENIGKEYDAKQLENVIWLQGEYDKVNEKINKQNLKKLQDANKDKEEEEKRAAKELEKIEKEKADKLKELQKQHEQFAEVISQNVTNALFTMYDAIQAGEPPLKALGDFLANLVKQFAAAIIQATIFKGIMALLNVATGGGAGFFGSILGSVGKLLGFAEGGIVSQPTIAMVGEGGQSEAIMPLNKLGNMMNSTFNAGAMSGGGAGNGQFVLKGNDLVLALQRSNYSLNLRRGA